MQEEEVVTAPFRLLKLPAEESHHEHIGDCFSTMAPEKAWARQPILILFPFVGDPGECRGDIALPPTFGPLPYVVALKRLACCSALPSRFSVGSNTPRSLDPAVASTTACE